MESVVFRICQLESLCSVYRLLCNENISRNEFISDEEYQFSKDNMLLVLIGYVYSIFDPSGIKLSKDSFPEDSRVDAVLEKWEKVRGPVTKIRNNLASHGSVKITGTKCGTASFEELGEQGFRTLFEMIDDLLNIAIKAKEENDLGCA